MCKKIIGNPAEVALIRLTSDGRLPPARRKGYSNVLNAVVRVSREVRPAALHCSGRTERSV